MYLGPDAFKRVLEISSTRCRGIPTAERAKYPACIRTTGTIRIREYDMLIVSLTITDMQRYCLVTVGRRVSRRAVPTVTVVRPLERTTNPTCLTRRLERTPRRKNKKSPCQKDMQMAIAPGLGLTRSKKKRAAQPSTSKHCIPHSQVESDSSH